MTQDASSRIARHDAVPDLATLRLQKLRSYNILDTGPEGAYQDIVELAKQVCEAPVALISFVEEARQWFKAESGLGLSETPVSMSVCAHAIRQPGVFVVPDLRADLRFADNPLTTRTPPIVFYAGAPLLTPDGFALGSVCVLDHHARGITPRQAELLVALARQTMTHLELRRKIALAASVNRYRSRLMAVAGHDLKQPLQVIGMVLGTQELKAETDRDRGRFEVAFKALADLSTGLDRLAMDSRIGGELETPVSQPFPIRDVLHNIVATWREHALHKGIAIRVVASSLWVMSDPTFLTTIIANLVGNAIKYTHSGGVLIGCRRVGERVCIHVMDTGIGVPAHRQAALYEAFHQEDSRSDGLGLGLSIVQRSAEAIGAKVVMRSTVNHGTNFSIAVPRATPPN